MTQIPLLLDHVTCQIPQCHRDIHGTWRCLWSPWWTPLGYPQCRPLGFCSKTLLSTEEYTPAEQDFMSCCWALVEKEHMQLPVCGPVVLLNSLLFPYTRVSDALLLTNNTFWHKTWKEAWGHRSFFSADSFLHTEHWGHSDFALRWGRGSHLSATQVGLMLNYESFIIPVFKKIHVSICPFLSIVYLYSGV